MYIYISNLVSCILKICATLKKCATYCMSNITQNTIKQIKGKNVVFVTWDLMLGERLGKKQGKKLLYFFISPY